MWCIPIANLTEKGVELNEQADAGVLPLLHALAKKEGIQFVRPVHVAIRAALAGETVLIIGTATTTVHIPCSRCLSPFDLPLRSAFKLTAVAAGPDHGADRAGGEAELDTDDMDVIVHDGRSIDLTDEIAQQLIMALPFNPQCTRTCQGLCSQCGANLNMAPCKCTDDDPGNPFAVLKDLSLPNNKE